MLDTLVREIEILDGEECKRARQTVHELRPLWDEERYRLGAGISYYKPPALYYATSNRMNPILTKHFGWLYDKLLDALATCLDCNVAFREDLALPGFNIYCGPADFATINYNIHVDLQFVDLNWMPPDSVDFDTTLSFTLPIASPTNGSGLNIWRVTQFDLQGEEIDLNEKLLPANATYQSHRLGVATVHDGKHYHQMAVSDHLNAADERITLQGHGLMQNGILVIYG